MERSGAGSGKSSAAWALPIFNAILYIKKGGQFQFLCTFLALSGSRKDGGSRQKQKERKGTTQSAKNNNQNRFYVNSEPTAIIARDDWLFICERGGFFFTGKFYDESREITQEDWPLSQTRWVSVTYYIQ